ncbi:alpha/beta-hydrolase [Tothia fuscella]|uniref:Alpha/beta-hydrolase n=1 Tax=Tothia fuscella TaxID=1048955 RepID=A0A9P4P0R2_9PEZI|nr:alpha/beta-hydrolase [Tothia fuscella]
MSTGVGTSSCCLSGKLKEGKPVGIEEEIGGLQTYVSAPENNSKEKTIIFFTDIFGYKFNNTRLLADQYAKAGFFVYVPDFFGGDALPIEFLQDAEPPLEVREKLTMVEKGVKTAKVGATLGPWLIKHREGVVKPIIDGFINTIRFTDKTDKVGVIGFCWGGRYAILAAHNEEPGKGVDAAYACHPSLVAIPGDFDPVKRPVSFALGGQDSLLGEKERQHIKEIMEKKKTGNPPVESEIVVYDGQVHGFALRGDWSSEKDKEAMDKAEKQGIEWFKKQLA